ncbi:MAG: [FeFe] hydrogenase H-cluster maturation GTPase HydF [Candidatus Omnitrophota bacterium]
MDKTPLSNRMHIGIFGRRNTGKSTLINAITGQDIAIVSDLPGTTTDPVYKAMEIHDIGPVVVIDTGGIDDSGKVGDMRVKKAYKILNKADVALLLVERSGCLGDYELNFIKETKARGIPLLVVVNKTDEGSVDAGLLEGLSSKKINYVCVSALKGSGVVELRKKIVELSPDDYERKTILKDMLLPGDLVLMVAPLDMEAPKGRLKLPQVQAIRDILDNDCSVMMVKEEGLGKTLGSLKSHPQLIITESQILDKVGKTVPKDIPLTTFSVLYARYKGDLDVLVEGASHIDKLKPGAKVLISEACTHHPVGDDIGRVVIPEWIKSRFPGVIVEYVSGYDFPADLSSYALVIHCGGCMLNRREMMSRIAYAQAAGVPITNYGMFLAHMNGMLEKVIAPFGQEACV